MENKEVLSISIIAFIVIGAVFFLIGNITGNATTTTQCNDKKDNDGDGRCDYGSNVRCTDGSSSGDSGCTNKYDTTEASCVVGSTTCGIGACLRYSTCVNDVVSCVPGSPTLEVCDTIDNDCDGQIDENLVQQCGSSNVGACRYGTQTCSSGTLGFCQGNIDPVTEICDGIDNDCDGVSDEGCNCISNQTRSCGTDIGACQVGTQTCSSGNWGACIGEITPSTEICDGIDNDCDGLIDEGCANLDSCSDTDGGTVKTIQGTVSGYKNNQFYSNTDFCLTNTTVNEYYCSGTNAFNLTISCTGNQTVCSSGKCI